MALITLAGRRWGPKIAGWLSAFPVVSAPILFFIAQEQGTDFASHAAIGTLTAVLAVLCFALSYAWAATRWVWGICIILAFLVYGLAVLCIAYWAPNLIQATLAVLFALLGVPRLFPKAIVKPKQMSPSRQSANADMIWRMLAAAILVFLVTHFSAQLGPRLSGLFAMFPVMSSVLAVFSHRHSGAEFTVELLRGMLFGYYSFSIFCLVLAMSLPVFSMYSAFALALVAACVVQFISRLFMYKQKN
jgi:uncharacterized membrane protein (GlpM family)